MLNIQHPDITRIERTGYIDKPKPLLCSKCNQEIAYGETYGESNDEATCIDCLKDEWGELTDREKFDRLGYLARCNE